ncbi:penicillin-binding protein 2B [Saliterribacillus persicus]|uniref:serine-type D-Ala-D-Ala carboxypeptidase n=1 Tax=Saliterribacillus persicus TaxID=930114 RepID=A0A368XUG5_9BACI|nr:penicillin-binding protein 2B [Saliterribacillus persicus]
MKNKTTHRMSIFWIAFFSIVFLVITGRFLYIQATGEVAGISLQSFADEKRTNSYQISAERGTIFDRNLMPVAEEHVVYRLYAIVDETFTTHEENPKHVKNAQLTAEKLSPILEIDAAEIQKRIEEGIRDERFQVEFGAGARELTQKQKEEIENLNLPGINFTEEPIRFYPNGRFASSIIGLTQKNEEKIEGISGIENQYNDLLNGVNGSISYQRDKFNVKLLDPKEIINEPENGDDVVLTLDQKIQTLLEDSMSEVDEQYEPSRMTAIVMDPKTGEILAMSNRPNFNPNDLSNVENWYNDAISTPFEPGSTMKIFTLAAAIEEGVWNENEYYKSGSYKIGSNTIRDHNKRGWDSITFMEGIQRSSNVAAAKLAYDKIGPDRFFDYLQDFNFDQPSNIDLPGEVPGTILYDYGIEKVTASFGQGSTVTPIQLVKAASAVANHGQMVQPFVVKETKDSSTGETISLQAPEIVGQPISDKTAEETRNILETVITSKKGTGYNIYNLQDYTVAGKTGTAEIPDPENPGYMTGRNNYVFSFLGMAPVDDPQLIMYIAVKQPKLEPTESGSAPVSYIFKNVMENSLRYLNIEPDKEDIPSVSAIDFPSWSNKSTTQLVERLKESGISPTVIGNGDKIEKVSVEAGEEITPNQRIFIITNEPTMPDISGWALRDVLALSELIDLDLEWIGNGFVDAQSIEKGRAIKAGDYLMVELQTKEEALLEETEAEEEKENAEEQVED